VNEQQKNEADRKPNSPKHGVNPDGEDHAAAGLEQQRDIFDGGQQRKLELGEQRDQANADRSQGLLDFLAEAGPRRRRRRRHEAMLEIFVLIHGGILPEVARPRESFSFQS